MRQRDLKLTSKPGEASATFKFACATRSEARDEAVDAVRKKFAAKQAQLAEQQRRAEASVDANRAGIAAEAPDGVSVGARSSGRCSAERQSASDARACDDRVRGVAGA